MENGQLVFRRNEQDEVPLETSNAMTGRHPLFGCMKGTVHIPEGVDLTAPADPEWGELAYGGDLPERLR